MNAKAIILRGGVKFGYIPIHLRLWSPFAHAGILLENGRSIEASAFKNMVIVHPYVRPDGCWDKLLSLDHLTEEQRERIGYQAINTIGKQYDWRAARGHALSDNEDDPRRLICFEQVGESCHGVIQFDRPSYAITPWNIWRGWRKTLYQ